eukprot:4682510-Prymnesium_polylepis.1
MATNHGDESWHAALTPRATRRPSATQPPRRPPPAGDWIIGDGLRLRVEVTDWWARGTEGGAAIRRDLQRDLRQHPKKATGQREGWGE